MRLMGGYIPHKNKVSCAIKAQDFWVTGDPDIKLLEPIQRFLECFAHLFLVLSHFLKCQVIQMIIKLVSPDKAIRSQEMPPPISVGMSLA